ncbi:MAG: glucuronate isomerase [Planctomycetes bacterium]|nr:glucuronate isomerase [Planctomycetota bacterium]
MTDRSQVAAAVQRALDVSPITDIHTHLYPPQLGRLARTGIDELLTYHYLVAELFRVARDAIDTERFWTQPQARQADLVWEHLFQRRSPISEACRGVVTCLQALGLDPAQRDLSDYRKYFAAATPEQQLARVLELSHVRTVVMTNDPLDEVEANLWQAGAGRDDRFQAALRIDPILCAWSQTGARLRAAGYDVQPDLSAATFGEVRRFLDEWIRRLRPVYAAAALPPSFRFPDEALAARLLKHCVLPLAKEHGLPFAVMLGVRRQVNSTLRLAGDGVGWADVAALGNLCAAFPDNRFLCTVLARENQHELTVVARKFPNLHVFGCWWFMNTPSLVAETTRMRIELLGHSFTFQHSDARVLEQLIYKWSHSKTILAQVLTDKYVDLADSGWPLRQHQIEREVTGLLGGAGWQFIAG